jgi:hypothetical protein
MAYGVCRHSGTAATSLRGMSCIPNPTHVLHSRIFTCGGPPLPLAMPVLFDDRLPIGDDPQDMRRCRLSGRRIIPTFILRAAPQSSNRFGAGSSTSTCARGASHDFVGAGA